MRRSCNCAGPCGPHYVGPDTQDDPAGDALSRRDFIALASIGTAGALGAGTAPEARAAAAADLAEWKRALHQPAAPRRYRSETHTDARMHLGGIGTGNFEIGADGQFTTWQLFNTLRDGFVPLAFGVRAGSTAKLLQTTGGPEGLPHVAAIEMTGDYPLATLKFEDSALPVKIEMSAFTPFSPLDTDFYALHVSYLCRRERLRVPFYFWLVMLASGRVPKAWVTAEKHGRFGGDTVGKRIVM